MGLTTGIYCAIIKCAVICLVVILTVTILRIAHSPFAPFFSRWYYRAYVDDAVLTALHPAANFSSTSSSIRYQLSLNITFAVAYGKTGYRDCSATAWYKNSMLNAPQDWIPPDQSKHGTKETVRCCFRSSFIGILGSNLNLIMVDRFFPDYNQHVHFFG